MTGLQKELQGNPALLEKTKFNEERFKNVLELARLVKKWREAADKMADGPIKTERIKNCDLLAQFYEDYETLVRIGQLSKDFVNELSTNILKDGELAPGSDVITVADIYEEIKPGFSLLTKIFE
jgi:hypothetical protein